MDLADLYTQLQEMGLPVDKQTLKNPTEEFMITFIMEYLRKFNFDGNEISKVNIYFIIIFNTTLLDLFFIFYFSQQ